VDLRSHDDCLIDLTFKKNDKGVRKLMDWETVSDFWPDQPAIGRLNVFATLLCFGE